MPLMQSSTELKCFKGLVYFYVVLLSVSDKIRSVIKSVCVALLFAENNMSASCKIFKENKFCDREVVGFSLRIL